MEVSGGCDRKLFAGHGKFRPSVKMQISVLPLTARSKARAFGRLFLLGDVEQRVRLRRLQTLNDRHAEALRKLLSRNNQPAEDAAFISIDRQGTDVRVRHGNDYSVERLGFDFVSLSSLVGSVTVTAWGEEQENGFFVLFCPFHPMPGWTSFPGRLISGITPSGKKCSVEISVSCLTRVVSRSMSTLWMMRFRRLNSF